MQMHELTQMVNSTADAAFAVDHTGSIVAWNEAAENLLNLPAKDVLGQSCHLMLRGVDESGLVCSTECSVLHATRCQQRIGNFDMQLTTSQGLQWCNISTIQVPIANVAAPYALHIVRAIDLRKRLEILVRDFIVTEAKLPPEDVRALSAVTRSSSRTVELTNRELAILRLLSKGTSTAAISQQMHISRTTVNNHIQHLMQKLNAHTRLEAIRRAERAGLI